MNAWGSAFFSCGLAILVGGCNSDKKPSPPGNVAAEPEATGLRAKDLVGKWRLVRAGGQPPAELYIKSQEIDIAADGTWTSRVEAQPPQGAVDRFMGKGTWALADGMLNWEYTVQGGAVVKGSGPISGKASVLLEAGRLIVDPDCFMQARKRGTNAVAGEYERSDTVGQRPTPRETGATSGHGQPAATTPTGRPTQSAREPPPAKAAAEPAVLAARATLRGRGFALAPDGRTLAYWDANGVRLVDLATLKERVVPPAAAAHLQFSPDGRWLAWATRPKEGGGMVHVWDRGADKEAKSFAVPKSEMDWGVCALALSADGNRVAATSGGKWSDSYEIRVWEIATGKQAAHFVLGKHADVPPGQLLFTPDGKTLFCGGLRLYDVASWDLPTGKERAPLKDQILLCLSEDGKTLATRGTASTQTVYLWDTATGAARGKIPAYGPYRGTFSPDGRALAVAGMGSNDIVLLDIAAAKPKLTLAARSNVTTELVFSPDGRTLAWGAGPFPQGASRGQVFLADTRSGQVRAILEGHTDLVHRIAFAEQGKTLVSAGNDGTVKLWDMTKAQP